VSTQRILIKATPGLPSAQLKFGAAAVNFSVSPLFQSIGRQLVLGAATADVWQILTPAAELEEQNTWDVCHALLQQGLGVAGAPVAKFAEPDFQQQWITGRNVDLGMRLARSCDKVDPQSTDFPGLDDSYWFRDSEHSQLDAAIAAIGGPKVASKVRLAHFDTGYDPKHRTLPSHLRNDLARNFVDGGSPHDATDRTSGPLTNLGHGTGTLSILAGSQQAGRPAARWGAVRGNRSGTGRQ
jgi:hypothetical protein